MTFAKWLIVAFIVIFGLPYCYRAGLPGYDGSKMICKDVVGGRTCYFYNPDGTLRSTVSN